MVIEQPNLDSAAPFDMGRAVGRWAQGLIDPTAANRLVYYRDLRAGTLDLTGADPLAVDRLLLGAGQTIGKLFPVELRADALRRARTIRARMRDLAEERGLEAGYVAVGLATWTEPDRTPRAPVLLYSLRIDAVTVAEHDFRLTVDPIPALNPVLLHKLAREFAIDIDEDELIDEGSDPAADPQVVFEKLAKAADEVPGFQIAPTRLVGTFTYEKLPMVVDLDSSAELLASSDPVAALAGDAVAATRLARPAEATIADPDSIAPADEFLVLDADASQSRAIAAVLAGQHLVIKGPPGTGKSQTIANLIAALAARGKTALFVAEKRAAIDAVVGRLAEAGLDDLVQNLHSEGTTRRQFAQAVAVRLQRIAEERLPDTSELHRRLTSRRDRLAAHHNALHHRWEPWRITAFEAQHRLVALGHARNPVRWRDPILSQLTAERANEIRDALAELARLGEFAPTRWSEPWSRTTLTASSQVTGAIDIAAHLAQQTLPAVRAALTQLQRETGFRPAANLQAARGQVVLIGSVRATLATFRPGIFAGPLDRWVAATADRSARATLQPRLSWSERRLARAELKSLWAGRGRASREALHAGALAAREQLIAWRGASHDQAVPLVPPSLDGATAALGALEHDLARLSSVVPVPAETITLDALQRMADALAGDQPGLLRAVRRTELRATLAPFETARLLEELTTRNADAVLAADAFDHAWVTSVLDHIVATDSAYAQFHGEALHAAATEYADADRAHIASTAARVRHAAASHLVRVLDEHPEQQQLIRKEAAKKARHLPMRELFRRAPEVLTAVKPCWAMSPLLVSQVLPSQRLFDVVIFDEASQVEPTEGITAIMRGRQVVVAGDEHQLPPTRFFDRADAPELDDDEEGELTADVESLLQAFAAALPLGQVTHLAWHYRSRDERLIAFSNAHIYAPNGNGLTTFPGTATKGGLTHVPGGQDEITTVVELILAHAEQRPKESLGVITMGLAHADRIDTALRKALAKRPELHGFFSPGHEPFFIKNIERVQGDERDAIIISVGYGKTADGRMAYRFGPLNNAGGHRRLNVAVTRAKRRVTVVSSFSYLELDPARLHADGAKLLRSYLEFAETGALPGGTAAGAASLTGFEEGFREGFAAAGLPLTPRFGVSSQRIDFAAADPANPEQMLFAIETDGSTYHSASTVRDRERLRREHLERLGWRYHRIWSTDWFRDPRHEIVRTVSAYQSAVEPPPPAAPEMTAEAAPTRSRPRPDLEPGLPITDYSLSGLVELFAWIESDGVLRTEDEVIDEAVEELAFQRRGPRIMTELRSALDIARATHQDHTPD